MKTPDISTAKNAYLRASVAALRRAAKSARQIAIQTNTAIVVVKDGKLIRIPAKEVRYHTTLRDR